MYEMTREQTDCSTMEFDRVYDDGLAVFVEMDYEHTLEYEVSTGQSTDEGWTFGELRITLRWPGHEIQWSVDGESPSGDMMLDWLDDAFKVDVVYEVVNA